MHEWNGYTFKQVKLSWKELTLTLKRQFNTAHSSSKQRRNFIVKVQVEGKKLIGVGQCGLPPKKQNCYLADIEDCFGFMKQVSDKLKEYKKADRKVDVEKMCSELFEGLPVGYFKQCRAEAITNSKDINIHIELLQILSIIRSITTKQTRAPYSAIQFAIFDLYSKTVSLSLTSLIFRSLQCLQPCSFYSVSYQDKASVLTNITEGLSHTHFIKLKCMDDIQALIDMMVLIEKETGGVIIKYIIDANASWSPKNCHNFLESMKKYQQISNKILYLEQPFPILMDQEQKQQWKQINITSQIIIVADESFFGYQDIDLVRQICKGINVKTEKAGGVINSVRAGLQAKKMKMELMLGTMVSSHLGSTQTYCLHPLTQYLDTDGSLLVGQPQIRGGFTWGKQGYLQQPQQFNHGTTIDPSHFA